MEPGPIDIGEQLPAAVSHARSLTWILAAFVATGFVLNVVGWIVADDVNVALTVAGGVLLALVVTAALGIGAGRPWALRVLTGALVLQLAVYVAWLLSGAGSSGVALFVLPAIAISKLRRPESQAYFSRTASIPDGCG